MDFKSMLASLWVPFFALLAFIPGSALNAIEKGNTTKMMIGPTSTDTNASVITNTTVDLAKMITENEIKIPTLPNDAINDKTVQQSQRVSVAESTPEDIEKKYRFVRKERNERNEEKAIKMAIAAVGQIQPSSENFKTILTTIKTEKKTTKPTTATPTAMTMETSENPVKLTTAKMTDRRTTRRTAGTGVLAMVNSNISMEIKDLFNPPSKEYDLASTITSTIPMQMAITNVMQATTTNDEITTATPKTTSALLRSPWDQVAKTTAILSSSIDFETPAVILVEKRTLNNINNHNYNNNKSNNNNMEINLINLSNDNNNKIDESQSKFTTTITMDNTITTTTTSSLPPPLPSPKYFHGSQNRNRHYQQQQIENKIRLSSHIYKNEEPIITSSNDMASLDCISMNCIKSNNGSQLNDAYMIMSTVSPSPSPSPLSIKSTLLKDTEVPLLTTSITTTTTMKSTTKPRRIVATTTLKPPPTIDDYRTVVSQAGTHAYLPCNVKQLVKKPISWLRVRDGHILTVDQTTFIADQRFQSIYSSNPERWSLQIKFVHPKDAGIYECQVSTEPKTSAIVNLHIIEPKTELLGESTRHVKAGSQVKLRCIISQALEPPLFINWFYNQKQIYLHNHKGWRTEIERIDLPPVTSTTSTTTTTAKTSTTTIKPTTTTTASIQITTTLPSLTTPTAVIEEGGAVNSNFGGDGGDGGDIGTIAGISAVSESTMASGATISHFSSSALYDGNAETVSSTFSTMLPIPSTELREQPMATSTTSTFTTMNTMAAIGMADVKQITAASLIIASVGKQDSGNYTCSPSNSAPRTIVLHVLNGEYSASAITSGCNTNILIAYNILSQWPHGTTVILILLWVIKLFVSMDIQWTCSQVRNKDKHEKGYGFTGHITAVARDNANFNLKCT